MNQAILNFEQASTALNLKKKEQFEAIIKQLGNPFFRTENSVIYHGDCMDIMKNIPNGSIDLSFTSPPYNIGKEYENIMLLEDYLQWNERWINLIHPLIVDDGAFILNVGYLSIPNKAKSIPIPYLMWDRIPFYLQQEIVWNYGAGVAAKKFLSPRNEKLLWYVKDEENYCFNLDDIRDPDVAYPNQKKKGKLRCNTIGKNPSDVWQIAKVTSGAGRSSKERTPHPAQFPLDLCERVIKGFSCKQDIVLEPFLGSGSTLESCSLLDRYSIGIEIKQDYCELARQRLQAIL
jgi:adenine-specific DNA-methyltransferase